MLSFPKKNNAIVEGKLFSTEKVTTSEEVDKYTKNFDDKKKAVVTMPLLKNKPLTTEKVTKSEEVDKGTKKLDDMKEKVIMIRRKDLYNF